MNEREEYQALLRQLPKDLTPDELARIKTEYTMPTPRQIMIKDTAIRREEDGETHWYGVLIFIHERGVIGHKLIPGWRQNRDDARDMAAQVSERFQDMHERKTGVRNRGTFEEDDEID